MLRRNKKESRTDHDIFKPRKKRGRGEENTEYPLSRMWSTPKGENVLRANQKHIAHNQQNIFHNQQNIFHNQQNIFYIMTRNTQSREFSKILLFHIHVSIYACTWIAQFDGHCTYHHDHHTWSRSSLSAREIQQAVNTFVLVLSPHCANSFSHLAKLPLCYF